MTTQLTVACHGAGYFSQFHYEAWQRNPRTRLIASADQSIEKAKATPAAAAFLTLHDMLTAEVPDLLDIITPPNTHLDAIKQAISFGIKLIVCQKPFCQSISEAEQAIALAKQAGTTLVIHDNFRFQPWFRCMKQAILDDQLGDALQLSFRLRTGDGQGAEAYLDRQPYFRDMPRFLMHETGVHYVDTFRYLLGSPNTLYADLRNLNQDIKGEDAGYFLFGYADGKRALFDGNRLLDHQSSNTRITFGEATLEGTKAELLLTGDGSVSIRYFGDTSQHTLLAAQSWPGFAGDCVYALQDHVVSALLEGKPLENEASDYLHVIKLVDTIYQSAKDGVRLDISDN